MTSVCAGLGGKRSSLGAAFSVCFLFAVCGLNRLVGSREDGAMIGLCCDAKGTDVYFALAQGGASSWRM